MSTKIYDHQAALTALRLRALARAADGPRPGLDRALADDHRRRTDEEVREKYEAAIREKRGLVT